MMKKLRIFIILILAVALFSCSAPTTHKTIATHETAGVYSELKSVKVSDIENGDLKSALQDLGMNATVSEKLTASRADVLQTAEEIFVMSSTDSAEGTPCLIFMIVHTEEGILISVDAIWDKLPADRYLDILGVYCNISGILNYLAPLTDAWIYYDGKSVDMKKDADYQVHHDDRSVAMSYDLGQLTKEMEKDKGPLIIHFDVYRIVDQSGIYPYNLEAYYDHGINGYNRDIDIVKSNSNWAWKFDIKDSSSMSAVIYEMACQSVLIYGDNK